MSTISTLNNLIETLNDGQEGFRAAAEDIRSPEFKSVFTQYSSQRAQFAGELKELVLTLGESPADGGSVSGAIHRGWIDLKAAIMSKDDHAILAECERGEDVAVAAYRKALEEDLPSHVRAVVQRQATDVKAAHDKVRNLRDSVAATK